MKIIFFGLGSIGNRHARILNDYYDHELFAFRTNLGEGSNLLGIKEVYNWEELGEIKPEVAFITNPTFLHVETAIKCARMGMKLFMEKPIGASLKGLDILLREVGEKELVSYVAYNLRFHPVIGRLKEYLKNKEIYHVSVYNSSFLPEWRPAQWHMDSYSSIAKKGGGVVLDLSHEFDYIEYLFGGVKSIDGYFDRVSGVTKDAEDFLDAVIRAETAYVNLHLDFFSRHRERTIRIDCDGEYIVADLIGSSIEFYRNGDRFLEKCDDDRETSYRKQLEYFFNNIDNNGMMNNIHEASTLFGKIMEFKKK